MGAYEIALARVWACELEVCIRMLDGMVVTNVSEVVSFHRWSHGWANSEKRRGRESLAFHGQLLRSVGVSNFMTKGAKLWLMI